MLYFVYYVSLLLHLQYSLCSSYFLVLLFPFLECTEADGDLFMVSMLQKVMTLDPIANLLRRPLHNTLNDL